MYKYEERIIKFNGVQLSKTGFKDLRFETSRFSDSLNTIRGFGSQMNESNLSVVDTISVDFILKTDELKDLAFIYSMFKAIGILPVENEYLIKKISDTLSGGNSTEYKFTHLLCFLERLQVTSLEKTSNGYDVNMILTLYQNSFVGNQYNEFIDKYTQWNFDTNFDNICNEFTSQYSEELGDKTKSDFVLNIYNVEKLNAYYKDHILDTEKINKLLDGDNEIEAQLKENYRINYIKNKLSEYEKYTPKSISIKNKHILQIELITSNLITNFPMKSKPIGYKSFLGIGKSSFSIKMIFDESENDIVQELKNISDKNIINHKFVINHPLTKLFDFYTSDITNMTFNNLESANGIIVTIVFNISGFRYDKDENLLNSSDIILKKSYTEHYIEESVCGLYLECLANYLMTNRYKKNISEQDLLTLSNVILESKIQNVNDDPSAQKNPAFEKLNYYLIDFLASYSSVFTSFGYHSSTTDIRISSLFEGNDKYNNLVNKGKKVIDKIKKIKRNQTVNIFDIKFDTKQNQLFGDDHLDMKYLNIYRDLQNGNAFYKYLDTLSVYILLSNKKMNDEIYRLLYREENDVYSEYLIENVINPLGIELFNTNQNFDPEVFGLYSKVYEEFYYRLFDIELNMNPVSSVIQKLKDDNLHLVFSGGIYFSKIREFIYDIVSCFLDKFVKSLKDEEFLDRIIEEFTFLFFTDNSIAKNAKIESNRVYYKKMIDNLYDQVNNIAQNNKTEIIDKIYNIFLTKLNYFLFMYNNAGQIAINHETYKLPMNSQIKVLLLSSCAFAPLFLYNDKRTDHFGKAITIGAQNIGTKIMEFNKNLAGFTGDNKVIYGNELYSMFVKHNELSNEEETNNIYQLFTTLFGNKINNSYYLSILKNSSILGNKEKYLTYDEIVKKDCLYFYGNKIPRYDIHNAISEIIKPAETKEAYNIINDFLSEAKDDFIKGEKYCETFPEELIALDKSGNLIQDYGFNALNKIERFHMSDIPSYYYDLFLDASTEDVKLNDIMKTRIIGNNDMFYNLDNISKVITDSSNSIIPDYVISIVKKTLSSEYAGEINTYFTSEYELFATNISNISIVKDPKTKIKTATIEIIDIKKHIFNVKEDGSFNIKELNNGEVEIISIEPGDEIRIKLGYTLNNVVFNGAISNINFGDNIMVLTCTSFNSLLYGYNIPTVAMNTGSSMLGIVKDMMFGLPKLLDSGKVGGSNVSFIYELGNILNNHLHPNKHLFNIFPKEYNNIVNFIKKDRVEAGIFTIMSVVLRMLPRRILEKFDGKLSNITSNKLLNSKIVVGDTNKVFGSQEQTDEMTTDTMTGSVFKNLNNVDHDYETYGINNCGDKFDLNSINGKISYSETTKNEAMESLVGLANSMNLDILKYNFGVGQFVDKIVEMTEPDGTSMFSHFPCSEKRISSLYYEKRDSGSIHKGIDIASFRFNSKINDREPCVVYAAGDGVVVDIHDSNSGGGGRWILIEHKTNLNQKIYAYYMHLKANSISVKPRDVVKGGQPIAITGGSGNGKEKSYINHLHFEIRVGSYKKDAKRLNPLDKGVLPYYSSLKIKRNQNGYLGQYKNKNQFTD